MPPVVGQELVGSPPLLPGEWCPIPPLGAMGRGVFVPQYSPHLGRPLDYKVSFGVGRGSHLQGDGTQTTRPEQVCVSAVLLPCLEGRFFFNPLLLRPAALNLPPRQGGN